MGDGTEKRSQGALEYLMSYGWIILVVFIAIGILTYFGVLRPGEQLPESCILEVGLACEDFKATTDGVTLMVRNSLGKDIKVEIIAIPKKNCLGVFNIDLPNGQRKRFDISCDLSDSEKLKADFEFAYVTPGGFKHTKRGSLVTLILKRKTGEGGGKEENKTCSDGALYGQCSTTKPKYCSEGILVNNCTSCGCDSNQSCQTDRTCISTCSDGTLYGGCSTTKPKYCSEGILVNNCSVCGCGVGQCQANGSCMEVVNETPSADIVWTKYSGNPVLTRGPAGAWDSSMAEEPAVVFDGNEYKMYYISEQAYDYIHRHKIGLATSFDGINWIKHKNNPVLTGTSGSWDAAELWSPHVLYDEGIYKMWYGGVVAWMGVGDIGYATSTDGINWVKHNANPVLVHESGKWDGFRVVYEEVIKDGGVYKMWYIGQQGSSYNIGYATSADGIKWEKYPGNPIISGGKQFSIIKDGPIFKMIHSCGPNFCYSTSQDGIKWNLSNTPVLTPGSSYSWDSYLGHIFLIKEDSFYKLWYSGAPQSSLRGYTNYSIGYACGCIKGQNCSKCF